MDIKKLLKWFDGKKTIISTFILMSAAIIQEVAKIWIGEIPVDGVLMKLITTLNYFGGIIATFGLSHKGIKFKNTKRDN